MKNRQFFGLVTLLFIGLSISFSSVYAQKGKYGATAEDSVTCVENLSVYKDFLKEDKYAKAKSYWRKAFQVCPGSSLKMYVDGEKILTGLINENKDNQERVNGLLDTMMLLFDQRIVHFGKDGYVLGKKGATMYKYEYPNYEEAFNTLKKSIDIDGNDAQAAAIIYYFQTAVKINEKTPKEAIFWVEMFDQCISIIDYNLSNATDVRTIESYTSALDNIVKLADPYLNCEVLVKFFSERYEAKKDDPKWLESTAKLLDQKDCSGGPFFYKVANRLHTLNPSAASAKNMGIMSFKKGSYNDAVSFFVQAIDLADDVVDDEHLDATLAELEMFLAKSYFGASNYTSARTHAQKAAGYKSNWGEPYMLIGDLYAGSVSTCNDDPDGPLKAAYWVAVDMYAKAKSVDGSVANDASQKIAKYSQYFPTTQDAFFYGITEGSDYTVKCWINAATKARLR